MPSTTVTLAYAIEVPIVKLGAHLQAYAKLWPAIKTLRLCNRYGQGDEAAVSRLPVELAQEIEDYMIKEERSKQMKAWAQDLKCWEGRCEPIDHLSKKKILEMYNDMQNHMYSHFDESDCGNSVCESHFRMPPATKCTSRVKKYIEELLEEIWGEGDDLRWRQAHDQKVSSWFERVGTPAASRRGTFHDVSDLLEKHFGLRCWISHTPHSTPTKFMSDIITGSTLAYLHLPDVFSADQEWDRDVDSPYDEPRRVKTEAGSATDVAIPNAPSKKSLSHFSRALKILECEPEKPKPKPKTKEQAITAEQDGEKSEKESTEDESDKQETVQPKLKMFIHDKDEEEDLY